MHFDGHGVYDREHGLGALCFEDPGEAAKPEKRRSQIINAEELAGVMRDHRVPLVFLEACQSAMADVRPDASVAGKLLQGGVASVVAMSHSVLVETARRFITVFYRELMDGQRIGQAMLAGQRALQSDTSRGKVFKFDLHLQDWFVPVLFQEELDPQLIARVPAERVRAITEEQRTLSLGDLPPVPDHKFVGRSRELLMAERLLERKPYVVLRGEGGEGKTTLAAELARWLVATRRFRRVAFISLETSGGARTVLYALGGQLVPNFSSKSREDDQRVQQLVERALAAQPTLLILDNMESVLPPAPDSPAAVAFEPNVLARILKLCSQLGQVGKTRLVFTSREPLPPPFQQNHVVIGRLDRRDAIALVGRVLGEGNLPHVEDPGESEEEIEELVDAVNCHARSLVLLAPEVAARGVRHATHQLHKLMADLEKKHPDDRERSLYASVELSLRRLTLEAREKVKVLGVFRGGTSLRVLRLVLGVDWDAVRKLTAELDRVGLAEDLGNGYLRLDPALPSYLLSNMREAEQEKAREAWNTAMEAFLRELQYSKHGEQLLVSTMRLELSNLLLLLERWRASAPAEKIIALAGVLKTILGGQRENRMIAQVIAIKEQAMNTLNAESREMLDDFYSLAHIRATLHTLQIYLEDGKEHFLRWIHAYFQEMQSFYVILCTRPPMAIRDHRLDFMFKVVSVIPEFMLFLYNATPGPYAWMADILEELIAYGEEIDAEQLLADCSFELALMRLDQKRYDDALNLYNQALKHYDALYQLRSVANTWHQIGRVYREQGQFDRAEHAYKQALIIDHKREDDEQEGVTLGELGTLYDDMGLLYDDMCLLEESARFHQQTIDRSLEQYDQFSEGLCRNNLAHALIGLQRYDEARQELSKAIKLKKRYGHRARPWTTWGNREYLEQADGHPKAAARARQRAIQCFLAYRRDGGESHSTGAQLCEFVFRAIHQESDVQAEVVLAQWLVTNDQPMAQALILKLVAILHGLRDPALADDPALYFEDAAELRLLLERL